MEPDPQAPALPSAPDQPLVSIVTPCHDCERFLALAIESVLAQTCPHWEMLVQDDGSRDRSYAIAEEYARRDGRVKPARNPGNLGAAQTRNAAIARSRGKYLAFLDADDLWFPEKLEKQLAFMAANDCDFVFSEYEHVDENGQSLGVRPRAIKRLTYGLMLLHTFPGCLTVMYDQKKLGRVYGPDVPKCNDRALFLRVLRRAENARGMPDCLALYRVRRGGISHDKRKMLEPFVRVVHEFEGKPKIVAYFCAATHLVLKKFFKQRRVPARDYPFLAAASARAASVTAAVFADAD